MKAFPIPGTFIDLAVNRLKLGAQALLWGNCISLGLQRRRSRPGTGRGLHLMSIAARVWLLRFSPGIGSRILPLPPTGSRAERRLRARLSPVGEGFGHSTRGRSSFAGKLGVPTLRGSQGGVVPCSSEGEESLVR